MLALVTTNSAQLMVFGVAVLVLFCIVVISIRSKKFDKKEDSLLGFRYNPNTLTIESTDPEVSIKIFGQHMGAYGGGDFEYVLVLGKLNFGFASTLPVAKSEDGIRQIEICSLGIAVSRWDRSSRNTIHYTNSSKFADVDEQARAIEIILVGVKAFPWKYHNVTDEQLDNAAALNNSYLSEEVKRRMGAGEFLPA